MNKNELIAALAEGGFSYFYKKADNIRKENFGNIINIRAILEFSNYCIRQCAYCGINAKNKKVNRYRMTPDEIISDSIKAYKAGYKTIVLQSGEDRYFTTGILVKIVKEIKRCGVSITLGCGERDDYHVLKKAGADRYLLKHETSDKKTYQYLHPNASFEKRLNCLKEIKRLGYETGSGFMIGLPNQTLETIAEDILLLKELDCDMAGIGPFIPHPDTPLSEILKGSAELTKRAVALARIVMPKINLPATTALGVINQNAKNDVFSCGANVIMKKITPAEYKRFYEIYPSEIIGTDIINDRLTLEKQIRQLGRIPD